jgi:ssDNA-binding protein
MPTNLTTPVFRGSYVNLFTPRSVGNGEPTYGMSIVLPKDKPSTKQFIASLKKSFNDAMTEKLGKVVPEAQLKHYPIKDGDLLVDDDGEIKPETKGCWVINAKNKDQPGMLVKDEDGTKREPLGKQEMYSGAFYAASISVYAWKHETGGKGVSVSLQGVMKMRDGEKFGGNGFKASDFDNVKDDTDEEL